MWECFYGRHSVYVVVTLWYCTDFWRLLLLCSQLYRLWWSSKCQIVIDIDSESLLHFDVNTSVTSPNCNLHVSCIHIGGEYDPTVYVCVKPVVWKSCDVLLQWVTNVYTLLVPVSEWMLPWSNAGAVLRTFFSFANVT